ncbi:hypothetical protein HDU81_002116 [Chytriomyces hyalinus]|nr:hypothetical protein HDU81_002116 [Chytriomyces hyalinus]
MHAGVLPPCLLRSLELVADAVPAPHLPTWNETEHLDLLQQLHQQSANLLGQVAGTEYPHTQTIYRAAVRIGTPGKFFRMLFDSGSPDLWVFGRECGDFSSSCRSAKMLFDPKASESAVVVDPTISQGGSYADGSWYKGYRVSDTISLGGVSITGHEFTVVTNYSSRSSDLSDADGIIGMGYQPQTATTSQQSLAERITSDSTFGDDSIVSYFINRTEKFGVITFGGYNTSLLQNESDIPAWTSIIPGDTLSSGKLALPLVSMLLDNVAIETFRSHASPLVENRVEGNTGSAVIDTGTSQSVISYKMLDALAEGLNKTGRVFKIYYTPGDKSSYTYAVECSMKREDGGPVLTLQFADGVVISVTALEYVSRPQLSGSISFCQLQFHGGMYGDGTILLGNTILKRYMTVFDYDLKRIGFALALGRNPEFGSVSINANITRYDSRITYEPSKFSIVGPIVGGVFALIAGLAGVIFWVRKRKSAEAKVSNFASSVEPLDKVAVHASELHRQQQVNEPVTRDMSGNLSSGRQRSASETPSTPVYLPEGEEFESVSSGKSEMDDTSSLLLNGSVGSRTKSVTRG